MFIEKSIILDDQGFKIRANIAANSSMFCGRESSKMELNVREDRTDVAGAVHDNLSQLQALKCIKPFKVAAGKKTNNTSKNTEISQI